MDNTPLNSDHQPTLIAFGSNIDPLPNLLKGLRRLHQMLGVRAVSTVYRTSPITDSNVPQLNNDPDFLNGAVILWQSMEPEPLKQLLLTIEAEMKRVRTNHRFAPRTLDLDIALMGERIIPNGPLTLPDPDIPHRPFLAIPLAELAPNVLHPLEKVPLSQIAARFDPNTEGLTVDAHATALLQTITNNNNEI